MSACSGHGAKFASVIGELAAAAATGDDQLVPDRFRAVPLRSRRCPREALEEREDSTREILSAPADADLNTFTMAGVDGRHHRDYGGRIPHSWRIRACGADDQLAIIRWEPS